jgi:pimeloyl-ACP methyl ester carboxylesterase
MTGIVPGSANGLSYLRCDGRGALPVVLLHGIGSNADSFEPLMAAMDGSYPTLAWNAPGYGDSAPLAVEWPDASDYAAALNRLLAHLQIARCVLVGHSLGNLIAARYAVAAPEQVAALILISPALGYGAKKGAALPPGSRSSIGWEQKNSPPSERLACSPTPPHARMCCMRSSAQWLACAGLATTRPRGCLRAAGCSMTPRTSRSPPRSSTDRMIVSRRLGMGISPSLRCRARRRGVPFA